MRVIVVGGGASGMMAALRAAESGAEVLLLEKNEKLGKKLFISGKGRCNLTNACDREEFFASIYTNSRFLYSAFRRFSNEDMMAFMEEAGVPVKIERGGRVFPVSDHSSDVIKAFERKLKRAGAELRLKTAVTELIIRDGAVCGVKVRKARGRGTEDISADRVIVATGGFSYPLTGSTGDGYRFAEEAGHSVTPRRPALVPLEARFCGLTAQQFSPQDFMGLSLKNVSVRFTKKNTVLAEEFGEMLFTHFGLSGPIILSCSSLLGESLTAKAIRENGPVQMQLDLKPALAPDQLEARFLRETEGFGAKELGTYLGGWLPRALVPLVLFEAGLTGKRKLSGITKKERERLLGVFKALPMEITALRSFSEAIITQGGVEVREIRPSTMESKLIRHLYFTGEVLDLDAKTGGYNLQIAWSTGYAAGLAAAEEEKKERKNE